MRTAASTVRSSLTRLCRWLQVRAIAIGVALVFLACHAAYRLPAAGADTVGAAHSATAAGPFLARPLLLGSGQFGCLTSKGRPVVIRVSRKGDRRAG